MNELRVWWASAVYDCEEILYRTKEEAIENAWMNDEANIFPVVEKSAYDELSDELKFIQTLRGQDKQIQSLKDAVENERAKSRIELFKAILKNLDEIGVEETISWIRNRGQFEIKAGAVLDQGEKK